MAAEHETLAAMLGTVGDGVRARRPPDGMRTRVIAVDGLGGTGKRIETPHDLRLRRGLERDGDEARGQWESWMAEEERYAATERPDENADLVVRGDHDLWT